VLARLIGSRDEFRPARPVFNGVVTLPEREEDALLKAAQEGDERAFEALVSRRRAELHAHCYRLLASPDDADDAVQEAMVRAWKGLPGFERRSSLRTWLFKITTNAALDIGRKRARRELPIGFGPASSEDPDDPLDIPWIGPFAGDPTPTTPEASYEAKETVELAYVAALQRLPDRQRAVFVLRDVLGFSAAETASILDTTTPTVTSSLQRARANLARRLPAVSQQVELSSLGDVAARQLAARYAAAIEAGDLGALLTLLTEDVSWSMPPLPTWYRGKRDVARFLVRLVFPEHWAHLTTSANGQLAIAGYLRDDDKGAYLPAALDVLELRGGLVAAVTGFLTGEGLSERERSRQLFDRFGLPAALVR
jgi:RNA polymerase sigma-70 factor, ECF subfamily